MNINSRIDKIEQALIRQRNAPPPPAGPPIDYNKVAAHLEQLARARAQRCGYNYERYCERFSELYREYRQPDLEPERMDHVAFHKADEQAIKETKVTA